MTERSQHQLRLKHDNAQFIYKVVKTITEPWCLTELIRHTCGQEQGADDDDGEALDGSGDAPSDFNHAEVAQQAWVTKFAIQYTFV